MKSALLPLSITTWLEDKAFSRLLIVGLLQFIRKASLFVLIFIGLTSNAQIISNPSFELFTAPCPTTYSQFKNKVTGWSALAHIAAGTPDYFNTCGFNLSGYTSPIHPYSGAGFAGMYTEVNNLPAYDDYKEYITNQLSTPLVAGVTYTFSFYTAHIYGSSPAAFSPATYTFNDLPDAEQGFLGAVFSTAAPAQVNTGDGSGGAPRFNSIRNDFGLGRVLIPKTNTAVYGAASRNAWVPVTLKYTAVGGETFMTIGQFRPGSTTLSAANAVYYLFDDFSSSLETVDCTQIGAFDQLGQTSLTGISDLEGFAGGSTGWPANVNNGHVVLESKKKGFVITRVSSSAAIINPVEGMLIYDIAASCIKLYNGTVWKCLEKDCNP